MALKWSCQTNVRLGKVCSTLPVGLSLKTSNFTIVNLIEIHLDKIRNLCAKHKVNKLFVFGSVLKDTFNKESDIDLVVDFAGVDLYEYADNYFDFKDQLEAIFNRPVDLLEQKAIKNPYLKKQIDSEKQLIYGQQNKCVSLVDILNSIEEIESFFEGKPMMFSEYQNDL